ncbi:malonic semialdehyde reductase [Georgenia sp. MJ206]|uniref:malonic semialdehyde reductase n=1 Tax=Georgenia wangjunii TaxID=3117730 RepID=UPI002F264C97
MTITELPTSAALDEHAWDLLFTQARTVETFTDEPVPVEAVRAVYEAVRWAPTAMNSSPLRLAVVTSAPARERLVAHLAPGNQAKTLAAPLTLVAAYDPSFHEHLPVLAPHRAGMREDLDAQPEVREALARTSALLQVGYLLVALRGAGLHVGPMTGMDAAGVDAELFAANGWRALVVLNVGHAPAGTPGAVRPRAARLDFADVVEVL